jgi:HAD superfamily hydrolase (TIGR01509 family)
LTPRSVESSARRYRVSHVFLDVDGTLVDYGTAIRAAFIAAAQRASQLAGTEITPQSIDVARRAVVLDPAWRFESITAQRRESVRRVLAPFGVVSDTAVYDVVDAYEEARDLALTVYDDVPEALQALADLGVTLIAASNGNVDLNRVGIGRHISDTHYATDIGVSKPDPRFFNVALERFSVMPTSGLVVGDRVDNDVAPALAAGMHGVLIDRAGANTDEAIHRIAALTELAELVERFEG